MIKITLVSFLVLCVGSTFAQDIATSSVPQVVKNALIKTHSNPRDIEWEKKGENYNVEYEIGKHDHELWISPQGKILKHKEEISSSSLPQGIKKKVAADLKAIEQMTLKKQLGVAKCCLR